LEIHNQSGSTVWTNGYFFNRYNRILYWTNVGGGTWYTSSSYQATQSFTNISTKDIEMKVTNTVAAWYGSTIPNYGFILKHLHH
jgi:hypothetical protein